MGHTDVSRGWNRQWIVQGKTSNAKGSFFHSVDKRRKCETLKEELLRRLREIVGPEMWEKCREFCLARHGKRNLFDMLAHVQKHVARGDWAKVVRRVQKFRYLRGPLLDIFGNILIIVI